MSATTRILDGATRHQVFLQRYAAGQSREAIRTLERLRRDLLGRLALEPTDFQRARLSSLLAEIESTARAAFGELWTQQRAAIAEHVVSEAQFSARLYSTGATVSFATPADVLLIQAVERAPVPTLNQTIRGAYEEFGAKKSAQILQQIRDGVTLGETTPEISSRVSGLLKTLPRRQVDALVRTTVNHTASVARGVVMRDNPDLVDEYRWVSTLDSGTTLICGSRDGETYAVGQGPMPPAHWGCRSVTIPIVKPEFSLAGGLDAGRPAVGADGVQDVYSRTTYAGWLKKQPAEFVDEALGPERSKLFRSGALRLDQFVDPTGHEYTLTELSASHNLSLR